MISRAALAEFSLATRTQLRVFDFDSTLVKTNQIVYITKDGKRIKKLSPSQFSSYVKLPSEEYDFSEFSKEIRSAKLIQKNIDLLKRMLGSDQKRTVILTARQEYRNVSTFLKSLGIRVPIIALNDANPQKKYEWIKLQIEKGFTDIRFMDDSNKNIKAVKKLQREFPHIRLTATLIEDKSLNITQQEIAEMITDVLNRKDMPQVNTNSMNKAVGLAGKHIMRGHKFMKVSQMKKTQKELIPKLIKIALKRFKSDNLKDSAKLSKKLVVSKDNWIIDGHHRWAAVMQHFGPDAKVPIVMLNLKKTEALDFWHDISDKITGKK